jgi:hypothetical protein
MMTLVVNTTQLRHNSEGMMKRDTGHVVGEGTKLAIPSGRQLSTVSGVRGRLNMVLL